MIWLTWRQHRKQAMYTLIALAALAALIVPSGLAMHHDFDRLVVRGCAGNTPDMPCDGSHEFSVTYGSYIYVCILLLIVPLLFGLFWGAPLVAREIEQGTHRMIWTQGISGRQWAWAKVGLLGGAVTVLAAVYGLGISWWYEPLGFVESRFGEVFFDVQGVAPVGYCLFAVALGIAAGGPDLHNHVVFQPYDRFWPFQWIEAGLYTALAVLLVWLAIRRIRRIV